MYGPGDVFGELSLLYNTPRAATIMTQTPQCLLYRLDRETFTSIVKEAATSRRQQLEAFLSEVEILK
jgi:cAMP-dependent protein kinase regulator